MRRPALAGASSPVAGRSDASDDVSARRMSGRVFRQYQGKPISRNRTGMGQRSHLAKQLDEVDTPALILDLDRMEQNIKRMAKFAKECGVALRPHVKTHKSPEIAKIQLAAGSKEIG